MKRVALAIAVVLTAIWYFQKNPTQKISESIEVQEDIEISATVEESQSRSPAMQMPLSAEAASSNAIKDEVLALSRKSMPFSELEDADREWVLDAATQSYAVGQVAYADLVQHIDELSEMRKFTMYERKETLLEERPQDPEFVPEGVEQ